LVIPSKLLITAMLRQSCLLLTTGLYCMNGLLHCLRPQY
jgi:hypothetical protein